MAVVKTLIIDVKDGELDDLQAKLTSVGVKTKMVEDNSEGAARGLRKVGENGGAIATLDALTGGLASRIRDAAEASKLFNISLKGTRTALLASGIGAFVVILGTAVAYWDEIVEFITKANKRIERQIALSQQLQAIVNDEIALLNKRIELQELEGKNAEDLKKVRDERIDQIIEETQAEIGLLGALNARLRAQAQEVTIGERIRGGLAGFFTGGAGGAASGAATGDFSDADALAANEAAIREAQQRLLDLQIQRQRNTNADNPPPGETRGPDLDKIPGPVSGITLPELQTIGEQEFNVFRILQQRRTNLDKAESEKRARIAELEAQAKAESYRLAADGFLAASEIIGQQTAAGKALAIASTVISTYTAAQKAYESQIAIPTPDAPARAAIAAAVAIAQGLARVKQILSVQVPGGGGGSIGAPGSAAPAFNVVRSSPQNQLNQALLSQGREPVQAFVVEGEVTNAQQMRRNKINSSSL